MQPITPCSFPKLRSNIPCADCYLISINNQHYFLLIYLYLMTMKTSYRKIYLFLLLLTSNSCNDLTETNMSIDIISMTKYNNRTHKLHSRLNDHRHFSETQIYMAADLTETILSLVYLTTCCSTPMSSAAISFGFVSLTTFWLSRKSYPILSTKRIFIEAVTPTR